MSTDYPAVRASEKTPWTARESAVLHVAREFAATHIALVSLAVRRLAIAATPLVYVQGGRICPGVYNGINVYVHLTFVPPEGSHVDVAQLAVPGPPLCSVRSRRQEARQRGALPFWYRSDPLWLPQLWVAAQEGIPISEFVRAMIPHWDSYQYAQQRRASLVHPTLNWPTGISELSRNALQNLVFCSDQRIPDDNISSSVAMITS